MKTQFISLSGVSSDYLASKPVDYRFIHGSTTRKDGTKDTFFTVKCETKYAPLYQHIHGLTQTATGYGRRIATDKMVKFNGKWRRVYCCIFSNVGTCYIGKLSATGENLIVREYV